MRCHSCGVEVREGQKFCMECGASLRGVADVTGEVPVVRSGEATAELITVPPPPPPPPAAVRAADTTVPLPVTAAVPAGRTHELRVIEATEAPALRTAEVPVATTRTGPVAVQPTTAPPNERFRLRPLLVVALLAGAATAAALLLDVVTITPPPDGTVPAYAVNDFGTNNAVAALISAGAMLVGALVWCTGRRWGAGLAGGAAASLAGWGMLVIGAAEWRLTLADAGADTARSGGYYALWAAAGLGGIGLIASLASSGRERRNGLDPWIAALAAASFVIAAGGPLIPSSDAGWASNWTGDNPGGLPTMFFVGRAVQLGLLVVCGVLGCLLVRRWGLGLAVGGALGAGWLLVTAATDRTPSPIGPGYANPLFTANEPHAVTVVGFALAGFFSLVAVVMALLDAEG